MTNRTSKNTNGRMHSQRFNQPPKLNRKHSVTIRFGAVNNEIVIDGHKVDLSRRNVEHHEQDRNGVMRVRNRPETDKDVRLRLDRTAHDLNQMVFT